MTDKDVESANDVTKSTVAMDTGGQRCKTKKLFFVVLASFCIGITVAGTASIAFLLGARRDTAKTVTIELNDQESVRNAFFHETTLTVPGIGNEAGSGTLDDVSAGASFDISWNAAFAELAVHAAPQRALHPTSHRLLQSSRAATHGSLFELTRDSGPGVLFVDGDETEGLSWHVAWQLTEQNIIVHRTHANGLRFTYVTDVPTGGLASASWTDLEKRQCDVELRSHTEYTAPALPTTVKGLLAQAGVDDSTRASMLDVKVLSVAPNSAASAVYAGCTVVDDLPDSAQPDGYDVETGATAAEEEEEDFDPSDWIKEIATELVDDGSGDSDAPEINELDEFDPLNYTESQLMAYARVSNISNDELEDLKLLADWEALVPSEVTIQLWPRADGASRSHTCATYEFLNPLVCDLIAPPTHAALQSDRRLSATEVSGFVHTSTQSEFTQILLEAANASPWLSTKLHGEDAAEARRHINDPAYLENVLDALDANRDGMLEVSELGGVDAASLAELPSSNSNELSLHGRKQFVFTLIAVAVRVAVHVAVRVAATAATTAVRVAPAVARGAAAAGRVAASGARVVASGARTVASRGTTVVRSTRSHLNSAYRGLRTRSSRSYCRLGRRLLENEPEPQHGRALPGVKCTSGRIDRMNRDFYSRARGFARLQRYRRARAARSIQHAFRNRILRDRAQVARGQMRWNRGGWNAQTRYPEFGPFGNNQYYHVHEGYNNMIQNGMQFQNGWFRGHVIARGTNGGGFTSQAFQNGPRIFAYIRARWVVQNGRYVREVVFDAAPAVSEAWRNMALTRQYNQMIGNAAWAENLLQAIRSSLG